MSFDPFDANTSLSAALGTTETVAALDRRADNRRVDFDTTVETMALTAKMNSKYKETSEGGLAVKARGSMKGSTRSAPRPSRTRNPLD